MFGGLKFGGFNVRASMSIRENSKNLIPSKISGYTVIYFQPPQSELSSPTYDYYEDNFTFLLFLVRISSITGFCALLIKYTLIMQISLSAN